eukprot:scaffold99873_cov33-Attheya_sp.AAC.4
MAEHQAASEHDILIFCDRPNCEWGHECKERGYIKLVVSTVIAWESMWNAGLAEPLDETLRNEGSKRLGGVALVVEVVQMDCEKAG